MAGETRTYKGEVDASEILAKIEKGEDVEYENVIIKSNLDIISIKLPLENEKPVVSTEISIKNSRIDEFVNFRNAIFKKEIDFSGTVFNGHVKSADFMESIFNGFADFSEAQFSGSVFFINAQFNDNSFSSTSFNGYASFSDARFSRYACFEKAQFSNEAVFMGTQFETYANFNKAKFNDDALFDQAGFDNITNFDATFCKRLELDESKIYSMHLSKAIFGEKSTISLRFSDFNRLETRWKSIIGKIEYDGSAYLALVKNFNNLEFFNDADDCYFYYRTIRRKEHLDGIRQKLLDYIAWIPYGYGVRPSYPLLLGVGLFFIFTIIYWFGNQSTSFMQALDMSAVILTTTTQIGNLAGYCRFWSIVERILGWLLMTSFLVVLAKKTIR